MAKKTKKIRGSASTLNRKLTLAPLIPFLPKWLWTKESAEIFVEKYGRYYFANGKSCREKAVNEILDRVVKGLESAENKSKRPWVSGKEKLNFLKDIRFILSNQVAFFNSPVWFNVGLYQAYGIRGEAQLYVFDSNIDGVRSENSAYVSPQTAACFIQSLEDSLEGIFTLLHQEARIFRFGSGSGTNFSTLRSSQEGTSFGGKSSGLLAFLEVFDKSAKAIKSGGVARRAAKMVCLDVDHPEILNFINWKSREEKKAQGLVTAGYSSALDGEIYQTVSGQNSNNSVRISDEFMKALLKNQKWSLRARLSQKVVEKIPANQIWNQLVQCAWECADPGVQFSTTIEKWNPCKRSGTISASNPCSEYMFLDDTACNLASINLLQFLQGSQNFQFDAFDQVIHRMIYAMDLWVDASGYPTEKIAFRSHQFRTLGLGYANLGALFMQMGIGYDSEAARAICARLTSRMTANAYLASTKLAEAQGAFPEFKKNKADFLHVLQHHAKAAAEWSFAWKGTFSDSKTAVEDLEIWQCVLNRAKKYGVRNAQVTALAPTGTIGLAMGCDTLGIEPEFALRKEKIFSGGKRKLILNASVGPALSHLGYSKLESDLILQSIEKLGTIEGAPGLKNSHLPIFDCAIPTPPHGRRFLSAESHLKMMSAAQPFLSGAISKTVNLPETAKPSDIAEIYFKAWKMGLKSVAIYRDGSKFVQPLTANQESVQGSAEARAHGTAPICVGCD